MSFGNYFMYITTNPAKTVLYVGMTNDLEIRINQHYENRGNPKSFAGRFYCHRLVYWEHFSVPMDAINREKQVKKWRREKKNALIESTNPNWDFLNPSIWSH